MDSAGSTKTNSTFSAQRRFFQWAVKWFYTQAEENTSVKPDVPSLVMLLQAVGFQLREFEKEELIEEESGSGNKECIKLTIKCGTSKMKAVLEMDGVDCQCPEETKTGSLWSISGHAPTCNDSVSSTKYEETGSNLLPMIPKGVNNVVRDIVYRLFKLMNNPSSVASAKSGNDLNVYAIGNMEDTPELPKFESVEGICRSYTQPTFSYSRPRTINNNQLLPSKNLFDPKTMATDVKVSEKIHNDIETRIASLQRQKTWDMDLDIESESSSPKSSYKTTSPTSLSQLYASLGQLSVTSDNERPALAELILKAYHHLDKAVALLPKKSPVTSSTLSLDDKSFTKPTPPMPKSASSSASSKPNSRPGSVTSMPSRLSQKLQPLKALNRRSIAVPVIRKPIQKTEPSTTPLSRQSTSSSISLKTTSSRLSAPKTRQSLISTNNSTSICDKSFVTKTRVSPDMTYRTLPSRKSSLDGDTPPGRKSSFDASTLPPRKPSFICTSPTKKPSFLASPSSSRRSSFIAGSSENAISRQSSFISAASENLRTRKSSIGANTSETVAARKSSLGVNTSLKANTSINKANTSIKSNTSLKLPTPVSKLTPPTSIASMSSRFGFSKAK